MSSTRKDTNDYLKMSVAITGIFGYRFQFGTGLLIKLVYTPIIFPADLTSDLGIPKVCGSGGVLVWAIHSKDGTM